MTDEPTSNNIVRFTDLNNKVLPVDLNFNERQDTPPDTVLEEAKGILKEVIVFGTTSEGNHYFDASSLNSKNVLWLLEASKAMLMEQVLYGDEQ